MQFSKVLFQIIDVLENFFEDVVETLSTLMFQGGALRSQELRVLLVVVQLLDPVFEIHLIKVRATYAYLHQSTKSSIL